MKFHTRGEEKWSGIDDGDQGDVHSQLSLDWESEQMMTSEDTAPSSVNATVWFRRPTIKGTFIANILSV